MRYWRPDAQRVTKIFPSQPWAMRPRGTGSTQILGNQASLFDARVPVLASLVGERWGRYVLQVYLCRAAIVAVKAIKRAKEWHDLDRVVHVQEQFA